MMVMVTVEPRGAVLLPPGLCEITRLRKTTGGLLTLTLKPASVRIFSASEKLRP